MYHRILPESDRRFQTEEPGMVVTPETFAAHMEILQEFFQLVSLGDWVRNAATGTTLPAKACAVTFDDGWLDNYEYAFPILQETKTPATLFAVAEMVGTTRSFWPNRIAELLAEKPAQIATVEQGQWLSTLLPEPAGKLSQDDIAAVIERCKTLGDDELETRLDSLELALGMTSHQSAMASWEQLREMQDSGLVEIGSHTCTHRRLLASLPPETAHREIVHSKAILEDNLGKTIELFCYPNGDCSPLALKLVGKHYSAAVTTRRGLNDHSTSRHQLNRIGIHEDASNSRTRFLSRLSGWKI